MSRPKTKINPKRAENLKKLLEAEGITQAELANRIHMTQQNISRIIQKKQALTEDTANLIIKEFPEYRIEWLLGYDDSMTPKEEQSEKEKQHGDYIALLCRLKQVEEKLRTLEAQIRQLEGKKKIVILLNDETPYGE